MSVATSSTDVFTAMELSNLPEAHPIATLTADMAAGLECAYGDFHVAYFSRLFRYILVLQRGDEFAARDVTQDTLMRVVRHIRRFEEEQVFWDWLTRLARTAAADHGRKNSRYRRVLEFFALQSPDMVEPPPDDRIAEAVTRAMTMLTPAERSLLAGKYEHGSSVRELAAASGVSEEAIESRLTRARSNLRTAVFNQLRHEK